jgi:hypothetical protein
MYFPLLDLPAQSGNSTGDHLGPPGVRNLQLWIEHAWKNGQSARFQAADSFADVRHV